MSVGGLSPPQPATADVQLIADQMKAKLESKENKEYSAFVAIEYRTQVVAGTNYFIKVQHGDGEKDYAHLRVFKPLPHTGEPVQLSGYQMNHTKTDPITYF